MSKQARPAGPKLFLVFHTHGGEWECVYYGPFASRDAAEGFANGFTRGRRADVVGAFSSWQRARAFARRWVTAHGVSPDKVRGFASLNGIYEPLEKRIGDAVFTWNYTHPQLQPFTPSGVSDVLA